MKMTVYRCAVTVTALTLVTYGCAVTPSRTRDVSLDETVTGSADIVDGNSTPYPLPKLNDGATLEDYLRYAALKNPGLKAAFQRWKASMERITQARVLPDPQLSFGYFIEQVETRVGPQEYKVELSQMFPWFGKLKLKERMAAHAAEAEFANYQAEKLRLFYQVKDAYYEYYYLARAIAITEKNMRLMKHLEEVARRRYAVGSTAHASVIKAQVELGRLEDRLKSLHEFRKPIAARLNAALNREPQAELPWPNRLETQAVVLDARTLLDELKGHNPELKALNSTIALQEDAVALAGKSFFPDVMVGASWIATGEAVNPDLEGSGDDPLVGMVGINLPIWQSNYRAAEREAQARGEAARQSRNQKKNALATAVSMALFKYNDANRKIELYGKTLLAKARQSLEVSKQAFESGKLDFLSLIDAERVLLEFELEHERALADRAQRLAELEMLAGGTLRSNAGIEEMNEPGK